MKGTRRKKGTPVEEMSRVIPGSKLDHGEFKELLVHLGFGGGKKKKECLPLSLTWSRDKLWVKAVSSLL